MSLLKYQDEFATAAGGNSISTSRSHLDGNVPWRGPAFPLKEDEYYEYTEEVVDFDVGIFDLRNPDEYAKLQQVLDRSTNGWYRVVDYDKKWVENKNGQWTVLVYLMWVEPYRQLSKNRVAAELAPTPIPITQQRTFR